ncbi:MAG: nuclear transport factor 2 family protein [Actinomycetota bacterium]|nr:nuclear transport factor 2 family protein [Actinomycetota bacterium]
MDRIAAVALVDRLHGAQNQFHGGGEDAPLSELLAADVTWTVPGENRIAGVYHGLDEVFAYFRRRRALVGATFRMHRRDILVGVGDRLAALTNGTASIAGQDRGWSTVGLYDVTAQGRTARCWFLPLDPASSTRSGRRERRRL